MLIANRADSEYSAMVLSIEGPLEEGSPGPRLAPIGKLACDLEKPYTGKDACFPLSVIPAFLSPRLSYSDGQFVGLVHLLWSPHVRSQNTSVFLQLRNDRYPLLKGLKNGRNCPS